MTSPSSSSSSEPASSSSPLPATRWTRPSELFRALECPASTVLPREEDTEGKAATWGKEVHKWVETLEASERVDKWLSEVPNYELLHARFWPEGRHEVLLRLDEDGTCSWQQAGTDEEREAFFEGGMIRGVADWIGESVVPHISDVKTGRFPPSMPPSENPQLLFYALVWSQTHESEPGVLVSIDHWPRYPKGAEPTRIGPDYVSREAVLEWYETKLIPARRLARREEAAQDARPGPWCQYCRCAPVCPGI